MTEQSRYILIDSHPYGTCSVEDIQNEIPIIRFQSIEQGKKFRNHLQQQEEQLQKQNQEIIACHDTLVTIEELCDAVLNYDFKGVESKVDYCHMLNEMDNKDLMFLKECFEAIRNNDLKTMIELKKECGYK